ncbi:MAG: DUF4922 domain-containing protein [Syntrophorhabdaceae bacterium]
MESRIYGCFDRKDASSKIELSSLCHDLISEQIVSWPAYKDAWDSLKDIKSRSIQCEGFSVRLIFNPGRAINTSARVDPEDIKQRPCFLCPANLPVGQKGILYQDNFLVLVNPRPVLPGHLTVAHTTHYPQGIRDNIEIFLELTADIGPAFTTLYNGPRCGASAPDHLHFQAVPSSGIDLDVMINRMEDFAIPPWLISTRDALVSRGVDLGREVVCIHCDDPSTIAAIFRDYMKGLFDTNEDSGESVRREPMVNVAACYEGGTWKVFIFPRKAHRPAAFYRQDDGRIIVSPAVMEMAGIIVTPREHDFEHLTAPMIEQIYREVSLEYHKT